LNIQNIISDINFSDNTNYLSIYVHIPFCKSKCIYCDFNSYALSPYPEYFEAIKKDIEFFGGLTKRTINSIYIGGGTPSIVPPELIELTLSQIFKNFAVKKDAEITIEVNPESLSSSKAELYKRCGINRVSVGIQSFNEKYLKLLKRASRLEDNYKALKIVEKAGFDNVSIDLMFGLPGQKSKDWLADLKKSIEFNPAHISAYMLTPPAHMSVESLPAEEKCADMLLECIDYLEKNGFRQYEISNYARRGYECQHNLNYWDWGEYLGFGAGAHSFMKCRDKGEFYGIRWWNKNSPAEFSGAGAQGRIRDMEYIDSEKALEEVVMLGLRKSEGIKISQIEKFAKIDRDNLLSHLKKIIDKNLLYFDGKILRLRRAGIPVANYVITEVLHAIN
jgi:oxygen-independent coproporphyrinogen-3 oxidase